MKLTSRFWPLLVFTFVGYANQDMLTDTEQKFVSPQFENVSDPTAAIDIQDFKPADEELAADEGVMLSALGGGGETIGRYLWMYFEEDGKYGWANMDAFFVWADYPITIGTALWAQNNSGDVIAIRSSGQVRKSPVTVETLTDTEQCAVANPFPATINIQDIIPDDAEAAAEAGVMMSILGGGGETNGRYLWMYFEEDNKYGWANMDTFFTYETEVFLDPGEGTWVQNNGEDPAYLSIYPPKSISNL